MNTQWMISIVIPVFNEEANLQDLIDRCLNVGRNMGLPFEMILVDDGSVDRSAAIIEKAALMNAELTGVFLNRNYGQHAAVLAGFETSNGEIVITLDADLQNPPEEIPKLVETVNKGYDVVGSVRANRRDTIFRKISSYLMNKTVQKTTGVMMNDYGCMLRAYRRSVVNAVLNCPERSTFIPVLANSFAGSTTEIVVNHDERRNDSTKYSLYKLMSLQFDLLTCMTTFPLRLFTFLGGIACAAGTGFGVLLIVMRLIFGAEWAAEGVFTLFAVMFVFIGAQFVALGLMGEYIGRIYDDVRCRPKYYIQKTVGKTDETIAKEKAHEDSRFCVS